MMLSTRHSMTTTVSLNSQDSHQYQLPALAIRHTLDSLNWQMMWTFMTSMVTVTSQKKPCLSLTNSNFTDPNMLESQELETNSKLIKNTPQLETILLGPSLATQSKMESTYKVSHLALSVNPLLSISIMPISEVSYTFHPPFHRLGTCAQTIFNILLSQLDPNKSMKPLPQRETSECSTTQVTLMEQYQPMELWLGSPTGTQQLLNHGECIPLTDKSVVTLKPMPVNSLSVQSTVQDIWLLNSREHKLITWSSTGLKELPFEA